MGKYIMLSSTNDGLGFNNQISEMFNKECINVKTIAFVPARFNGTENIMMNAYKVMRSIKKLSLKIEGFFVCLPEISSVNCKKWIKKADMIFLMGGLPEQQMQFMKDKQILELVKRKDLIAGVSAGAMNLSTNAICVRDADYSKLEVYNTLNLADIYLCPHYHLKNSTKEEIDDYFEASKKYKPIFYLADDTALLAKDNKLYLVGKNAFVGKKNKMLKYKIKKDNKIKKYIKV